VRSTGSGAGCGGHWPLCNGLVIPRQPALETIIEYTHRFSSGLALVLVAGMLYLPFRTFPSGHRVRKAAIWAGILIILEALLGAGLVVFELVGGNNSVTRAVVGAAHLLNTFLLLASLSLACSWSTWEPGPILPVGRSWVFWLTIGLLGVLFIGMTGEIAALGDTLFPPVSVADGFRQDLAPDSHFLLRLRGLHPIVAVAISFILIGLARVQGTGGGSITRISSLLFGLTIIQLIAGTLNLFLLATVSRKRRRLAHSRRIERTFYPKPVLSCSTRYSR